jgi:flavin reductase (DIM6/NTAB) family NADH-FMN oxidoreductase RutF
MNLPRNDRRTRQFVTNVGLITSNGPLGINVMAAEWNHHVSYSPSLIAVNVRQDDATAENIKESKEFGVNLAAEDQNIICSITGQHTGKRVDKIALLKKMGIVFYESKKIKVPMITGAAMNAECKLIKQEEQLGDHIMFVGEVVEISADERIKPLIYQNGKYWKLGDAIAKPAPETLDKINELANIHRKF